MIAWSLPLILLGHVIYQVIIPRGRVVLLKGRNVVFRYHALILKGLKMVEESRCLTCQFYFFSFILSKINWTEPATSGPGDAFCDGGSTDWGEYHLIMDIIRKLRITHFLYCFCPWEYPRRPPGWRCLCDPRFQRDPFFSRCEGTWPDLSLPKDPFFVRCKWTWPLSLEEDRSPFMAIWWLTWISDGLALEIRSLTNSKIKAC